MTMNKPFNKIVVASAGSGKTTMLVDYALALNPKKVLITTYTISNEQEIRRKIIEKAKCIPPHIQIIPWITFLLHFGARPFQGVLSDKFNFRIAGYERVNGKSGVKYTNKNGIRIGYKEETEFISHYFNGKNEIYSDKLPKLVCKCDVLSKGAVVDRIENLFDHILIDEFQDMAGYDLEFIEKLLRSQLKTLLVGDPRQAVYSTNTPEINREFLRTNILAFFKGRLASIVHIDEVSMMTNYRCQKEICAISNLLFPEYQSAQSGNEISTGHDGIYFVRVKDVDAYLEKFRPVQLRDSKSQPVNYNFERMNFGISKGLTFTRTLIYPTKPIMDWFIDKNTNLALQSRSNLYVALTRARQSVGIVWPNKAPIPDGHNEFIIHGIKLA
jgi:superfamily I DNA/RNA helicase